MTALYRPYLDELNLTYPQYLVMLLLWQHKQLAVNQIGQKMYLDSGTLTPLLKRMEDTGLVQRQRCTTDERRLYVSLTKAGTQLQKKAAKMPVNIFPDACVNLNELNELTSAVAKTLKKVRDFENPALPGNTV